MISVISVKKKKINQCETKTIKSYEEQGNLEVRYSDSDKYSVGHRNGTGCELVHGVNLLRVLCKQSVASAERRIKS